jgi:hypothetical protein
LTQKEKEEKIRPRTQSDPNGTKNTPTMHEHPETCIKIIENAKNNV